jgi:hypothetical protein
MEVRQAVSWGQPPLGRRRKVLAIGQGFYVSAVAVGHSHIVPAGYLRQFALEDEEIKIVLTSTGETIAARTTVRNAGVRGGGHYNFNLEDGSQNDDFESVTLQKIENDSIPILRDIGDLWPLCGDHKLAVATFIGMQVVRGPRWFA